MGKVADVVDKLEEKTHDDKFGDAQKKGIQLFVTHTHTHLHINITPHPLLSYSILIKT